MTISDPALLQDILREAPVLFLALRAEAAPYVVPVSFGIQGNVIYIHGAPAGRKIELLRADPRVGFSACSKAAILRGADACSFSASGRSVVGTGRARVVTDEAERISGLDAIMRHYGDGDESKGPTRYRPEPLSRTCVIAIHVETLTGKRTGAAGD